MGVPRDSAMQRITRKRFWWIAAALLVVLPLGAAAARQLAQPGGSPATGSAQVVTQGVATLSGNQVAWRVVERTAPPRGQAKPAKRALGFVLASDEPILLTDLVSIGTQGTQQPQDVARLAPGEAFLVKEGIREARASLSDQTVKYLAMELVAAADVDNIGSGKLLFKSDPFTAPTGERDIDLVRNVLEAGEQATVPDTGGSTVILATDGAIDILPEGGRAKTSLVAGESSKFDEGQLQITGVSPSGAKRVPVAAMTDLLAQQSTTVAAYVVAVIGVEIPPPSTPTATAVPPTETPVPPTETPVPPTATSTPQVTGSIAVAVYNCPPGMTADDLVGDTCNPADPGYDFALTTPDGGTLKLADAASKDSGWTWSGLAPGQYGLVENPLPEGFESYFIPGSDAVSGSPDKGYTITIDESAPDVQLTVYNFQPVRTGSITVLVFNCPPSASPDNYSPTACPAAQGGSYDFSLSGPTLATPLTVADASTFQVGFAWSDVPFGKYALQETQFPPRYSQVDVPGSSYDDSLGGYVVEVGPDSPDVTVSVYNFVEPVE
jgi:hypothetical protein